ncbi:sigma-70 family RNA polymerase sigma factor [uncultured Cellulomonas sp.]|uniref:sigma-70 family RNA polymerase sigma factor n=1 Tax=uncultured Cellulomonas sp. TaxID=189682 RepID=UPI0028E6C306|nr:sigma-70 family RNA polymerase sigma factor [uncultured Cellulomonas sp.]
MDWQDVLDTLVRDRGPALLRYGYLLTGDAADAQELVQDALVSVLARKARLREPAAVEGYVRQTMLSTYIDGYRRRRRWLGLRHLLASPDIADAPQGGVDTRRDVIAALAGLAPRVRACVVLRYFEDLPVADIANRLQISDGAVKRYLSDGVHALERVLGPVQAAAPTESHLVTTRSTR